MSEVSNGRTKNHRKDISLDLKNDLKKKAEDYDYSAGTNSPINVYRVRYELLVHILDIIAIDQVADLGQPRFVSDWLAILNKEVP